MAAAGKYRWLRAVKRQLRAADILADAARLADEQRARRIVPEGHLHLEIQPRTPRGDAAQIKLRGAFAAQVKPRVEGDACETEGLVRKLHGIGRRAVADHAVAQRRVADVQPTAVEVCAITFHGGEHLVDIGVVYRRGAQLTSTHVRDGDAAVIEAAGEIHRPVDGVDDKQMPCVEVVMLLLLLAEEACLRHGLAQHLHEIVLHALVIFGHNIAAPGFALRDYIMGVHHDLGGAALGRDYFFDNIFGVYSVHAGSSSVVNRIIAQFGKK